MLDRILPYSRLVFLLLLLFMLPGTTPCRGQSFHVGRHSFNDNWKFHRGEAEGAEQASFEDGEWRDLDLPHDWAIEGPFDVKYNARCGGLPFHGTGWYRKHFQVPAAAKGKKVFITFDGAMYNAHVWLNGHFLGNRPFGYIEFQYEVSKYLNFGGDNVIAVKLVPEDLSSRWYPGAGIYRHVWLDYKNPVHIPHWGTTVTTPEVTADKASIDIKTDIAGAYSDEKIEVKHEVLDPVGEVVAQSSGTVAGDGSSATSELHLVKPKLWNLDSPHLYRLRTSLHSAGKVVDSTETRFGIRRLEFEKNKGFSLNGKPIRIQGVCLHHDNGPLGAIVNRRADQRKLQIMKQMGVNSVRTSHNPPSNEFLDLCDELGILVQVEAFDVWRIAKVPNGYNKFFDEWAERDIKDMVRRDRNHPSVFMWSIGNEILEQGKPKEGNRLAELLNKYIKSIDTTRPTTCGFNNWPGPYKSGMAAKVDIAGMNYKPLSYGAPVAEFLPNNLVVGSETSSCTSSRGVYHLPIEKYKTHESLQVTSYDIIGPPWAYPPDVEFDALEKNPEILGEYVWTGFDYIGEPTPYGGKDNSTNGYWNADWPARSSYFGAVDLCGFPKDRFFLYQSQWTDKPMVHVLPHWNWEGTDQEQIPIFAYTNCEEVELFVNGKSLGRKVKGTDLTKIPVKFMRYEGDHFMSKYRLSWEASFAPGSLRVVGYVGGEPVTEKEIKTAGPPARVRLVPDREVLSAGENDLSYVTVRIEDTEGNLCPLASNQVRFSVEGAGTIAAVGNGNAATTAPFIADERDAFNGLCMLIVKAGKQAGEVRVIAQSEGLQPDNVSLSVTREEIDGVAPDLEIKLGAVSKTSVFENSTWSIWGGSVVEDEDGLYHMLYSRWPKKLGWAWVTDSEIAHATSKSPFGPFKHQGVALPRLGKEPWDGWCTHNPTVHKFGEKYYLYYMGNTGAGEVVGSPGNQLLNWEHRNNQRIGVAVAERPEGPWVRMEQPVIDISDDDTALDSLMTSNPSVCQRPNGEILMVYKAVGKKFPLPGGGPVVHMVAIADNPLGPFVKSPNPVFTHGDERFPAEDPYIWFQEGKYRAIVKRMKHLGGQRIFSLVHYDSIDGIDWQPAKFHEISDRTITWEDGTTEKLDHLERPQVVFEDGKPIALICAADRIDEQNVRHSFNVQIPLSIKVHQ